MFWDLSGWFWTVFNAFSGLSRPKPFQTFKNHPKTIPEPLSPNSSLIPSSTILYYTLLCSPLSSPTEDAPFLIWYFGLSGFD